MVASTFDKAEDRGKMYMKMKKKSGQELHFRLNILVSLLCKEITVSQDFFTEKQRKKNKKLQTFETENVFYISGVEFKKNTLPVIKLTN